MSTFCQNSGDKLSKSVAMSIVKPISENELNHHDFYYIPKEVKVNQFYPVLDYSFGSQPVSSDKSLLCWGPGNEGFGSGNKFDGSMEDNVEGCVFSTAVSEESIVAAKERSEKNLTAEDWSSHTGKWTAVVDRRVLKNFQQAMRHKEINNQAGVISSLNKAINLKPDEPAFYEERGEAFLRLCDLQSAILNYRKACHLSPNSQRYHSRLTFLIYLHGQVLFDQKLYSQALEAFTIASAKAPQQTGYLLRCLTCLAALEKFEESLAIIDKKMENPSPDLLILRARVHDISGNMSLCYWDVNAALALEPDHAEGQAMMATIVKRASSYKDEALQLSLLGNDQKAIQKISLAVQTDPSMADYYVLRGTLYRKLKDFNSAIDDFLRALEKCGQQEQSLTFKNSQRQLLLTFNDFAIESFHKGHYQEAIVLLSKAIKGEKHEKSLYVNRGDCFWEQGEVTFALQDYEQALELDPHDKNLKFRLSHVHSELGERFFQEKKYQEAESETTLALQFSPHDGQRYIFRSQIRYLLQDASEARKDFLRGFILSPKNKKSLPLLPLLFPGKSVADIIHSSAARKARLELDSLVGEQAQRGCRNGNIPEHEKKSVDNQDYSSQVGDQESSTSFYSALGSGMHFSLCTDGKK